MSVYRGLTTPHDQDTVRYFFIGAGFAHLVCIVSIAAVLRSGVAFKWRRSVTSTLCRIVVCSMVLGTMYTGMYMLKERMAVAIHILLYAAPALPPTGNGAHILILAVYVSAMLVLHYQATFDGHFANVGGIFTNFVGLVFNLKMEHSSRKVLCVCMFALWRFTRCCPRSAICDAAHPSKTSRNRDGVTKGPAHTAPTTTAHCPLKLTSSSHKIPPPPLDLHVHIRY
jgi:hypothetical protein